MKKSALLLCLVILLIMGCTKVNQENYNKLKVGLSYNQVTEILGKPDECNAVLGAKNCTWGDKGKNISVQFVGDEVIFFSSKGI